MKRTKWYPANIDPVHKGIYECQYGRWGMFSNICQRKWDGKNWWLLNGLWAEFGEGLDRWRGQKRNQK
jgi:hypothetical protein